MVTLYTSHVAAPGGPTTEFSSSLQQHTSLEISSNLKNID